MIKIRPPKTKEEFDEYFKLRFEILVKPWNQPRGIEQDDLDKTAVHMAAFDDNKVVGCGRLHFDDTTEAKVRYMAIDSNYQGQGIGSMILKELEEIAKDKNCESIYLKARETAVDFYKKMAM